MKKALFCLMPLLALMACGGCVWTRAKMNDAAIADRARASVVPGRTRAADLKGLLKAEPGMMMPMKDGSTMAVYGYSDAKTEGLTLILVNFLKTNISYSSLYVIWDAKGVVTSVRIPSPSEPAWEWWPFGK